LLLIGSIGFIDLLLYELLVVTGPVANWLRRATHTGRRPQLDDEDADENKCPFISYRDLALSVFSLYAYFTVLSSLPIPSLC
jgi:hypothetical protein